MIANATTPAAPASTGVAAMHEMRATRKRNRLGDIEWFDAAYRVYMVALFGGGGLAWLSGLVGDAVATPAQSADVLRHGPAVLGMVAVVAIAAGLRAGSQGGPLALEAADVSYVMLSPVPRRAALMRPAVQRLRSAAFTSAAVGGSFGVLAAQRLPGSAMAWLAGGALFALNASLLWSSSALVAHALRIPLTVSTLIALAGIAWQTAAIVTGIPGPANLAGSLGLWGWRQRTVDAAALVLTAALVVIGLALVARTSIDALARRSALVAQLRFAVTMQDLRTVVLLRRQLAHEHTRGRPWMQLPTGRRGDPVWRRGWHSLLRMPVGRLVRMTSFAVGAAACQVAVFHGTSPAFLGAAALAFVLGMEVMEPLSQEIDQPDRTASFPVERGHLLVRHLAAPAAALVPFAAISAVAAVLIDALATGGERVGPAAAVAAILALPTLLAGAAGAAVSIVRDAPDATSSATQQAFLPPEMAGLTTVLRTLIPLVVSGFGAITVLVARAPLTAGDGAGAVIGAAARGAVMAVLVVAATAVWVRRRDRWRIAFQRFMADGRAQTQQQRSTR